MNLFFFIFANKATGVSNKQASTVGWLWKVWPWERVKVENVKKEYTYPHQLISDCSQMRNQLTKDAEAKREKKPKRNSP